MSPASSRALTRAPRLMVLLGFVLFASLLFASPTQSFAARGFRVTSKVRSVVTSGTTRKIVIVAKTTRRARIKVTISRNGEVVRVLRPGGKWYSKKVRWNVRDSAGRPVAAGTYRIKVTAKRNGKTTVSRRTVRVRRYKKPWIGFYVPGVPSTMEPLYAVESATGVDARVVNFFISDSNSFPRSSCQNALDAGAIPMVTLEFWSATDGGLSGIVNGSKDAYLRDFADSAKAYGGEVWLRPFHEMNGNWYPWAGTTSGNSPAELIAAWRHVYSVFQSRGATNVKFIWSVNNESVPNTSTNSIRAYWPGSEYVDRVALDGYNFGGSHPWRSFKSVFGASYSTVTKLTSKPVFIAETACSTTGGSKSVWISEMFRVMPQFPRIRGVVWFNADKERDWRIESSATTLEAFQVGFAGR